ncbi:MAG: carbohydrate ABC transporter permease [Pelolinea sp.]|jgi:multiple sugar transport system permease protein|nr:carbohydrate ABC transporter permease [Pelolinea sp.]
MRKMIGKLNPLRFLGIVFFLFIVLFPVYWLVVSSFKTQSEILAGTPQVLPLSISFNNYKQVWKAAPLLDYFKNSLIITVPSMIIAVTLATMAGYALSRFEFAGKSLFRSSALLTQLFPGILFLLPYFLMFSTLQHQEVFQQANIIFIGDKGRGWNYVLMSFTYIGFVLPFALTLMCGFFNNIPKDIEEAAMVDGCTQFQAFRHVILPLVFPAIASVTILAFLQCWNEILFASVLTNSVTRTIALGIRDYRTQTSVAWNLTLTAGVIVTIPVVVFFTFLQKQLVSGLTAGAVKG